MLIDRIAKGSPFRGNDFVPRASARYDDPTQQEVIAHLERRLGRTYARQRLGIERDHEVRVFGDGLNFFHIENWYAAPWLIRGALRLTGLYRRARQNAERVIVRQNIVRSRRIPAAFHGYSILHITDMHVDISEGAMRRLADLLPSLNYDLCVLTGDYRGKTYGPFKPTLDGMAEVCRYLKGSVYGVLGNHDTIQMVPGLESLGIRMLLNENEPILYQGDKIYLAGIDDAHFYRVDNIEKAASDIPDQAFSILLSHTPEIYRQAAHAGFDLTLSGHTHGGQLCLPGSIPITLDSVLPRRMGSGAWRYHNMLGYTSAGAGSSILAVRLNCPPEITLHRLQRVQALSTKRVDLEARPDEERVKAVSRPSKKPPRQSRHQAHSRVKRDHIPEPDTAPRVSDRDRWPDCLARNPDAASQS